MKKSKLWPKSNQFRLDWLCWLAGKSKMAWFFSIFLGLRPFILGETHWDLRPHSFFTYFLVFSWSALALHFSFGTFDSFLAGMSRYQFYDAYFMAQTAHNSAKQITGIKSSLFCFIYCAFWLSQFFRQLEAWFFNWILFTVLTTYRLFSIRSTHYFLSQTKVQLWTILCPNTY